MTTRTVEMYVGLYEGNAKTWYETEVTVPADTPDDQVEPAALRELAKQLDDDEDIIAFYGMMPGWNLAQEEELYVG